MKKSYGLVLIMLLFVALFTNRSAAQDMPEKKLKKGRLIGVAATQAIGIGVTMYELSDIWYKDYPRTAFHFKSDMKVWHQVDKTGHAYTAYTLAGPMADMYSWAGLGRKSSAIYGTLCSYLFMTSIEVLDGQSEEWGFSYGDMLANTAGAALFLGQELGWEEQRVQLKFSYHNINYEPYYKANTDRLFGTSLTERMLKDYNAQTYWLSVSVHSFGVDWWPKWLNVAVGHGGEQMYGAYYNSWKDENGKYYDANHIPRLRQWYISPDINFAAINTGSGFVNALLDRLTIKLPAPTLEYRSNGKLKFHAIYF